MCPYMVRRLDSATYMRANMSAYWSKPSDQSGAVLPTSSVSPELVPHSYSLDFEVPTAQQGRGANELARRQFLCSEVGAISSVEFVVQRQIRASNLHINKIIHAHARLHQGGFHVIQKDLDFLVGVRGSLPRLGIQPDSPGQIQCIAGKNGSAKGCLRIVVGKVNGPAGALRWRLRKNAASGEQSRGK